MSVQHTSGPWIARRWWEQAEMDLTAADADERKEWQDAPYKDIYSPSAGVTVMACHDLSEVSPMDARLIAASPDMLAVLEALVSVKTDGDYFAVADEARAVILKAKGGM
jgi:hypothetical protein